MDYRQRLEVETPEHVMLDYEIAGLGSRTLAALVDSGILLATTIAMVLLGLWTQSRFPGFPVLAIFVLLQFAVVWGYFALFEGLRDGQTPGKKLLGIRVIQETGHGITMREATIRNLLRIADFLPPPYLLGAVVVALHPKARRLGDLAAGTVVVRDRPVEAGVGMSRDDDELEAAGAPLLGDQEFQVLREFTARAPALDAEVRARLTSSLASRFSARVPARHQGDDEFLQQLLRDETARRRGRFAIRAARGPGAGRGTANAAAAQRLVARKDARWREFEALAGRAARQGLNALGGAELPDFAARYREIASDLARMRSYGADATVRSRLERVVATGHNLLYRGDRRSLADLWHFIVRGAPSAVSEARAFVLVAFLAFAVPAAAGYATFRARPGLAEEALPSVLLERAEEGLERKREGRGYADARAGERPHIASAIITNNVGVAFVCFAGGIFLAIGSLLSLAFNGLLLGAVSGHYHNVGLLDYLWTFVAGHGVLELFAIWCAGAAGLLIGTAMVRPGAYSRKDALVIRGRLAIRLVGFATILLLIAGLIEGFVSTSTAGAPIKVSVSVASAVFLAWYLWIGRGAERRAASGSTV
ncbi:MAG: stage II sporulation protein M [Gemmatimonadaceae bacterium]